MCSRNKKYTNHNYKVGAVKLLNIAMFEKVVVVVVVCVLCDAITLKHSYTNV